MMVTIGLINIHLYNIGMDLNYLRKDVGLEAFIIFKGLSISSIIRRILWNEWIIRGIPICLPYTNIRHGVFSSLYRLYRFFPLSPDKKKEAI